MKHKLLSLVFISSFLAGCAHSVDDYQKGVDSLGKRDIALEAEGYEVFGFLRALFHSCRPLTDDSLNARQSLWTYYYSSPPMWGYDYEKEQLEKHSDKFQELTNNQSLNVVCDEFVELAKLKLNYLGQPIDAASGPNMLTASAINSSHNTTVMAHNMGHTSVASGMAAITLLQSAIAVYQMVDHATYEPNYGLPPIPSSAQLESVSY